MLEVLFWLALGLITSLGVAWLIHWAWFEDRAEQRGEQELVDELEAWRKNELEEWRKHEGEK